MKRSASIVFSLSLRGDKERKDQIVKNEGLSRKQCRKLKKILSVRFYVKSTNVGNAISIFSEVLNFETLGL